MTQEAPPRRYTWDDLVALFPVDNVRREIIDGELLVSPSGSYRHQAMIRELTVEIGLWVRQHGGLALPSPLDVMFTEDTVLQPDVLFFGAEKAELVEETPVTVVPDLVAEVSSPSNLRWDRVRKLAVYERFGVGEYWFVDLQQDLVEVFRLVDGCYPEPEVLSPGDTLTSPQLPGFSLAVKDLLSV